jgi:hypothetical protein
MMILFCFASFVAAERVVPCDVIVAGGSLAAFAAALTSAREGMQTCLLEPTDEAGGQMISVPAVDYAWHSVGAVKVGDISKQLDNLPKELADWKNKMGNPGKCWVSVQCFKPQSFTYDFAIPAIAKENNLKVFYNTVVKSVETKSSGVRQKTLIQSVIGIQRTFKGRGNGYDVRLSKDMPEWYTFSETQRFKKETIKFTGPRGTTPIVIDATELAELLPLSGGSYIQGYDKVDGSLDILDEKCGQAIVFPFVRQASSAPENSMPMGPPENPGFYALGKRGNGVPFSFQDEWRYRRLHTTNGSMQYSAGDLSVSNWNPGNDYPFQYLFKPKAQVADEVKDWAGGIDYSTLEKAERHAIGWHYYLKRIARSEGRPIRIYTQGFKTSTGLSKFPYLRDTRRTVGIDNFIMQANDIRGGSLSTGTRFADRVALGAYVMDFHSTECSTPLPAHLMVADKHDTLPYYLPLRSFTNRDVANLIMSGKSLAVSYATSSATRLQPQEYTTGIASGVIAAYMVEKRITSTAATMQYLSDIRSRINAHAPTEWNINGVRYPTPSEALVPIPDEITCPDGADWDPGYGFCVSETNAYGPFTVVMSDACLKRKGGQVCTVKREVKIKGKTSFLQIWEKQFAFRQRGDSPCPAGSERMTQYGNYCVETINDTVNVFGPFSSKIVQKCLDVHGKIDCYHTAYPGSLFLKLLPQ